ncbi:polysaccharide export outer membrane protein [Novosphingobium hassiacum]|uniref:Polysaccharide export outer membrane protein n=1 Tax=Novosphingobium hassiacum TaxID=173676 RepID=A0A7W5ZVS1_9SPHN|nr:polysaccharide biosynthesis/export family protein [Novosphingobium hassiacum]MBB3860411.1 polysaccharide export outer membrane protein [Novosphingobium hassiacum]
MNSLAKRRTSASVVLVATSLVLGACASTPPPTIGRVEARSVEADGQGDYSTEPVSNYKLHAGDVLNVTVFREPDLSVSEIPVGVDGTISTPLVGVVRADGLTPAELSSLIETKLRAGFLKEPSVSVNVTRYDSHVVTVDGSVEKPGVYQFRPGARLSTAMSLASGPSRVAKLEQIAVFRQFPDGMKVAKFDYAAVRSGSMMDPVLQPGDRIVVGTSGLSQFWQDFLKAAPVFAIFSNQL